MEINKNHLAEIRNMTTQELKAFRNILEFNLRGILIGNIQEVRCKLFHVVNELARRGSI